MTQTVAFSVTSQNKLLYNTPQQRGNIGMSFRLDISNLMNLFQYYLTKET